MSQLQIGAHVTLRVDRLTLGGDGLGRAENAVVFVPYGSPGDLLEVELTEVRKNFARARLLRVIEASQIRVDPPCPYHFQIPLNHPPPHPNLPPQGGKELRSLFCGGCSWQHMNYEFQLDAKRELVQETLERIGGLRDLDVEPVLGMKNPWRYRNKVQEPIGWDGQHIVSGFYAPFSHDIVPITECLVQSELSVRLLNRARDLLEQFHLRVYDEDRNTGWIRHLWVRTAQNSTALLVFITRTDDFPHESQIVSLLTQEFPGLVGIHQNVNPGKTNVILGRHWRKCWGEDYLEERLGSMRFQLSPGSFFQVNSEQTEVLYNTVKAYAGSGDTLVDLYGGVGGIALWLASNFKEVIGVDEVRSAIFDARNNARLNNIKNARFIDSSAEQFIARFKDTSQDKTNLTVILDPPRAGCDPRVLQALIRLRPTYLIYVSCDPGTLARDLAVLMNGGFVPRKIQPVDLFPQTPHIETVILLTRLN